MLTTLTTNRDRNRLLRSSVKELVEHRWVALGIVALRARIEHHGTTC
jgi:hypothetical protein